MEFTTAINILRGAIPAGDDQIDNARTFVCRAVCDVLDTPYRDSDDLCDWIIAGEFTGNETAQSIANEWVRN